MRRSVTGQCEVGPKTCGGVITASGTAPANSSLTKRCPAASDQAGSLAARRISVKRSDMVPAYSAPLRVATRRPPPLVTYREGQRMLTVHNG